MKIELSELKEFLRYNIDDCDSDDFDRGMKNAFHVVWNKFCSMNYQPTSRPCFDKPAGTPILHRETL